MQGGILHLKLKTIVIDMLKIIRAIEIAYALRPERRCLLLSRCNVVITCGETPPPPPLAELPGYKANIICH